MRRKCQRGQPSNPSAECERAENEIRYEYHLGFLCSVLLVTSLFRKTFPCMLKSLAISMEVSSVLLIKNYQVLHEGRCGEKPRI